MRRSLRISAWIAGSLAALMVLLIVAVLVAGNTGAGRAMIERLTYRLTGGNVKLTGLGGSFPSDLTLDRLELIDRGGVWLTAEHIALRWSPSALLERRIQASSLTVARLDMERTPLPSGTPSTGKPFVPHVDIDRFSIDVVQLGAALAGRPVTLSIARQRADGVARGCAYRRAGASHRPRRRRRLHAQLALRSRAHGRHADRARAGERASRKHSTSARPRRAVRQCQHRGPAQCRADRCSSSAPAS